MKFTKIFDVTDNESLLNQSQTEDDVDQMHQYEDSEMLHSDDEQHMEHDLDVLLPESRDIMADWTCAEIKIDEINSDALEANTMRKDLSPTGSSSSIESMDSFYKPEADQNEHEQLMSEHVQTALRRDVKDYATITRDIDE